jgi:hypothetical protein
MVDEQPECRIYTIFPNNFFHLPFPGSHPSEDSIVRKCGSAVRDEIIRNRCRSISKFVGLSRATWFSSIFPSPHFVPSQSKCKCTMYIHATRHAIDGRQIGAENETRMLYVRRLQ